LSAEDPSTDVKPSLSDAGRWLVLGTAFLGWFFAGFLLSTTSLAMRPAAIDLLGRVGSVNQKDSPELEWFAYYQCAFLFGAAAGGLMFGRLGDRIGRSPAMAASILCYSLLSAAASFAQTPAQLLVLWFLACLGVGGMWPNGVALLSETWPNMSRPLVAGVMGTAANVGIFALATLGTYEPITPEHWRWVLLVCAAPAPLGLFVLLTVPESPRWLAARAEGDATGAPAAPVIPNGSDPFPSSPSPLAGEGWGGGEQASSPHPPGGREQGNRSTQLGISRVFRPPFLGVTLVGILLATIPLIGGWGSANWMIPWADKAAEQADPPDAGLKARVSQARSLTGIVGSLLGGWVGHVLGRRRSYCLVSLAALFCAQYAFWLLVPTDLSFLFWAAALGFFSGIFFGWLPLFLPELFPTAVRSTGAGVSFNFGRILTAVTVFTTGALAAAFNKDYAAIGRVTSLVYLLGAVAIWLAPDTTRRQLED